MGAAPFLLLLMLPASSAVLYAATPVQLDHSSPTDYFFAFDPTVPLADDVDVVTIHDDFYGVPWDAFLAQDPSRMPLSWAIRLNQTMTAVAAWDKPVFLGLEMLSGTLRTCPAQNASDGPGYTPQVTPFPGCSTCYDFNPQTNPDAAALIQAYALYAAFYAKAISHVAKQGLVAVNFGAEINLGARLCSTNWWEGVVAFSNGVYSVLKQELPSTTLVFPSLQLEVIAGVQTGPDQPCVNQYGTPAPTPAVIACMTAGIEQVSNINRDAFAVSTYPSNMQAGFPTQHPGWPAWYIPTVLSLLPVKDRQSFVVAETGFSATDIVVNLGNGTVGGAVGAELRGRGGRRLAFAPPPPPPSSTTTTTATASSLAATAADPPVYCATILNSTEAAHNAWLAYLIDQAEAGQWPLLVWWSDKDLLYASSIPSCPCTTPPAYAWSCTFITAYREIEEAMGQLPVGGEIDAKAFAAMGLRGQDGTPRQAWYTLQAARKRRDQDKSLRERDGGLE